MDWTVVVIVGILAAIALGSLVRSKDKDDLK